MIKRLIKLLCCTTVIVVTLVGCSDISRAGDSDIEDKDNTEIVGEYVDDTEKNGETEQLIAFTDKAVIEDVQETSGPYFIRINKTANIVEVFSLEGENQEAELVKRMLCSVGTGGLDEDGDSNDTPLGRFKIYKRYRWSPLFGNVEGQYAVRFNGHILFHSVPYTKQDKGTLKDGEYNKLGTPASMGCVRLSVADAKWIYDKCPNGTEVEVIEGSEAEAFEKPLGIKIADDSEYSGWDPTDPDKNNPWIGKLPKIENVKDITILKDSSKEVLMTVLNEVHGTDYDGTRLEAFIENIDSINLGEYGTYEIIYGTTGVYGVTVFDNAMINVVDEIKQ